VAQTVLIIKKRQFVGGGPRGRGNFDPY